MRPVIPFLVLVLALGCARPLAGARTAVNAVSELYDVTAHGLVASYEAAQIACWETDDGTPSAPPATCVAEVRARWRPVREAVAALYQAIVIAQAAVRASEAAEALGREPELGRALAAVAAAVDAAERVRVLVEALSAARTP